MTGQEQWSFVELSNFQRQPLSNGLQHERALGYVRHYSNDCHLALRYVKEGEMRVLSQKQLIAGLEGKQQPTLQAEESLGLLEIRLKRLRTHLEIMSAFMRPALTRSRGPGSS